MFFERTKEKIAKWFMMHAEGPRAKLWLVIISFTESSIFPIPPDPFLMAILLVKKDKWLRYSLLVAVSSVAGGLFGYAIGFLFFDLFGNPIVSFYNLEPQLISAQTLFNENAFWAIFTAAFTPVPYKIFTIAGGLFHINLIVFILASVLGRGIRFLIIGFLMNVFGERIGKIIVKYFNTATLVAVLVIVIYILFKIF